MLGNRWAIVAEGLHSSYKPNQLGLFLYWLVRANKPYNCVEIGVLEGYSGIYTMAALQDNVYGYWTGYCLFENYEFRNCTQNQVVCNFSQAYLNNFAVARRPAEQVPLVLESKSVDFCHYDISNDGDKWVWALDNLDKIMAPDGLLVLEGGSPERDRVDWMLEYQKTPMNPVLKMLSLGGWACWEIVMHNPFFPSMTVLKRTKYEL